jgi:fatty acid desaturase
MWSIYGNTYDLTEFIDHHPGGKEVLLKTRGTSDLTAMFESYHAFSDIDRIRKSLDKYLVKENTVPNPYDFATYRELAQRMRHLFPNRSSIKAPWSWYIQFFATLGFYLYAFYIAMFSTHHLWLRAILASCCGTSILSIGFTAMHDGSHYAIVKNPIANQMASRVWHSWVLWNANVWFHHHVIYHHSFTGEDKYAEPNKPFFDPDLYHLYPAANKLANARPAPLYVNAAVFLFQAVFLPGMYFFQGFVYLRSIITHQLFHIKLPKNQVYYSPLDLIIMLTKLYCLYCGGLVVAMSYIVAANAAYSINIFFDHDTYETIVDNHYTGKDWARLQIHNSGNFMNGNMVWTRLFGGINHQIEHHLFPSMSNVHYSTIAPIVRDFCREKGIPYVHHPTLMCAFRSYVKMIRLRNEPKQN